MMNSFYVDTVVVFHNLTALIIRNKNHNHFFRLLSYKIPNTIKLIPEMWPLRRVLKYGFTGGILIGGVTSLHANQYDVNSIGVVRLGRSAITVSII